jgi:altronate hydrolase
MQRVLQLDFRDNVLIALEDLRKGETVSHDNSHVTLLSDVPAKHKFPIADLAKGDRVTMYGVLVGKVSEPVRRGELLSASNFTHEAPPFGERSGEYRWAPPDISRWKSRKFLGYARPDGQVGTRNYWIVVPLVFCENRNILNLRQAFEEELGFANLPVHRRQVAELAKLYREGKQPTAPRATTPPQENIPPSDCLFPNIDGIKFLLHEGGCGGTREDSDNLCGLIAGYVHHPNVAGATVLSLGCQHAQTEILRKQLAFRDPHSRKPLIILEQQKSGSEFDMLSEAIERTFAGLAEANKSERTPEDISKLCVGLKCGGSDGFSGLSANPAVGHASDLLVALGARTLLSEFPELRGVEQNLIDRAVSLEVSDRLVHMLREYEKRADAVKATFALNVSPGNTRGGLLTDAMKSAGAAKKGGTAPVEGVLDYPEYAIRPGLNLQCTPDTDVECVTAQVGAGASVVLFTTGLGTPVGNPIAPVVKLSSNTLLAQCMPDIIDFDAGCIITGDATIEETGEKVLDLVIQVASGDARVKAELNSQDHFIPWKRGVSL